jgi:hypothetical protein
MADELVYRMAISVADRRFPVMGAADSRSLRFDMYSISVCNISFVAPLLLLFDVFWGDMRREFMQRLFAALHSTLGSYLRDALHEGSVDAVACLLVPRA